MRRVLLLLLAAVLLAGCDSGSTLGGIRPAQIDVNTPQLRQMKRAAGVEPCRPGHADPPAGGLPQVTLPCLGGGPSVDLSSLRGPLVINFWASNCTPCRTEMPMLQRFYQQYGDQVDVIGIDWQDVQAVSAMQLVRKTGVTYPLLADPQAATSGASPFPTFRGLPFWVVVDADGKVTARVAGEMRTQQQLLDLVRGAGVDL